MKKALAILSIISAVALPAVARAAERPPNFVFILMDDMGTTDLGCYGSKFYQSPNIDRLASEGMKFTQAYAACPVCSPTRASIMTGKYPARVHLTDFIPGRKIMPDQKLARPDFNLQLPLEEVTLPEKLKSKGYVSGAFGKWHLGKKGFEPEQQGFDVYDAGDAAGGSPGSKEAEKGEYGLTESAMAFIEKNKDRPFFVYLPYYSVHIPLNAKQGLIDKYEKLRRNEEQHTNSVYAAMIESVDAQIGRLMKKIDDLKLRENTVVIFASDNGGLSVKEGERSPATSNYPFREGKGYLHEGGIRVPVIIRWPGVVSAGTVSSNVISSVDYFPTLMELAGIPLTPSDVVDGKSIVPLLKPNAPAKSRDVYWHYPHYSNQGGAPGGAIRDGDWKLIQWFEDGSCELYNLASDPYESQNLATQMPEKVAELVARLDLWRRDVGADMMLNNPNWDPTLKRKIPASREF